jgi:hypothetical protein
MIELSIRLTLFFPAGTCTKHELRHESLAKAGIVSTKPETLGPQRRREDSESEESRSSSTEM